MHGCDGSSTGVPLAKWRDDYSKSRATSWIDLPLSSPKGAWSSSFEQFMLCVFIMFKDFIFSYDLEIYILNLLIEFLPLKIDRVTSFGWGFVGNESKRVKNIVFCKFSESHLIHRNAQFPILLIGSTAETLALTFLRGFVLLFRDLFRRRSACDILCFLEEELVAFSFRS
ncbi:hypothetical protein HHK36_031305 [Tetracentron sinense]|uniref:Uncharacterized protein n=1 Tax=Tetracentron sinense TaxID=13715 RepID=A0A835CZ60_TETSI|nr:hypothetical protein HHK36_031305 [Tetracentron sinense]